MIRVKNILQLYQLVDHTSFSESEQENTSCVNINNDNQKKRSKITTISFPQVEQHKEIFPTSINFKMRSLFAIYFIVNVLALFAVLVRARRQSCTANHCGKIGKDIKTLQTEVKNLIALVKDALPSKLPGTFSDDIFVF